MEAVQVASSGVVDATSSLLHVSVVVGIDPGLDGAVAALPLFAPTFSASQEIATFQAPTLSLGKAKGKGRRREYDTQAMKQLLRQFDPQLTFVVIEGQRAMPRQGVVSMFRTGLGFGLWWGIVAGMDFAHAIVQPQEWQKKMLVGIGGEGKGRSVLAAGRHFPMFTLKASQHGIADALLLADYGRRAVIGATRP